ncbi:hypothetical protein [Dermacoccus sp. Ellin185]|uniref:hypothetical protein n=1 Tax=Dermacoccus sp. Ellin185 TaxID=188626 RepID=UPI001C2FA4C2|nr:hypothetical protein [Dermacoccus sp. Ellin185]
MSEITTKAQELLAGRLESVQRLEQAHHETARVRSELAAAERAEGEAWSNATAAGWTPTELKRLGFTQPASRRGGRPARRSGGERTAAATRAETESR